jgi:hypothetical protein
MSFNIADNDTGSNSSIAPTNDDVSRSTSALQILRVFVLATGVVGVLANGFITFIIAISKQLRHEKVNILVLNQTILDFVSSFMLMVIYSLRMCNLYLTGPGGYSGTLPDDRLPHLAQEVRQEADDLRGSRVYLD